MLNYNKEILDNGLTIISAPNQNTKAVTILCLFGVGSRFEDERINGLSHFLEHMFFKGTKKRPTTLDISRELDSVGAGYNAYTGEESTGYFVRVPSNHFDMGLDVLTDMLFNSKFDATEIEKEKGVIIEEINMYNDDPRSKVELEIKDLVYPNQPLGRNIAGSKNTVSKFTREDFIKYKDMYYRPSNMVVVIAGGANHDAWKKQVKEKFLKYADTKFNSAILAQEKQSEPQVRVFYKKTDQAHFILGYRSISRKDPRRPAMKVLTNIMGQMMSSRLFIEVREKRGLCYYVGADMADFQDTGFWEVHAGVDLNRVDEAIKVILDEIGKLKKEHITAEELVRAKENLKGHMYINLEDSMAIADFLAVQQLFWGEIKDPDELAKEIDSVSQKDIQDLARELFVEKNLNLAIIGPFEDKQKFIKLLNY